MGSLEDRLFVTWRRNGDLRSLARVYDLTAEDLLRIAMHLVRQPATAEDLVQATFVAAIEEADRYDEQRPLRSWLAGILHNQAKWRLRQDARSPDPSRLPTSPQPGPLESAASAEFSVQVDAAIARLPDVYRPVLRLSLKHQLSAAEIAHSLGRPAGTVRSQLVRGLELLRAELPAAARVGALGVALAALLPRRGLAAIREQVLAHGARESAAVTAALSGAIIMKKALGIAACVLLLFGAFWSYQLLSTGSGPHAAPAALGSRQAGGGHGLDSMRESVELGSTSNEGAIERRRAEVAVETGPDWWLVGRVATADGPGAGAIVQVLHVSPYYRAPIIDAVCADDGSYRVDLSSLARLPRLDRSRAKVSVTAFAAGHAEFDSVIDLPHHDPTRRLELRQSFRLERAAVARGIVLDASGTVVEAASVRLLSQASTVLDEVASDGEGRYRLSSPQAGEVTVDAVHARLGTASRMVPLRFGADTEVPDLRLRASSALRARLVFEDREPVRDFRIRVGNRATRTDEHGRFSVSSLAEGEHSLRLIGESDREPRVVSTGVGEQLVVLAGKHLVRMRFEDAVGRELRPFSVSYRIFGSHHGDALRGLHAGGMLPARLEEDASGRGRVDQLLLTTGSWLWIRARSEDATGDSLLHVDGSRNVVEATMQLVERKDDAKLRVVMTSVDGLPVGPIDAELEQVRPGDLGVGRLEPTEDDVSSDRFAATPGEHTVFRAPPGLYRLRIEAPNRSMLDQQNVFLPIAETVRLQSGEETVVPLEVQPVGHVRFRFHAEGLDAGADIAGLTIDTEHAEGRPQGWRGQFITKQARGWMTGPAVASRWLGWRIPLPAGRHLLSLESTDYEDQQLSVVVGARQVVDVDVWLEARR